MRQVRERVQKLGCSAGSAQSIAAAGGLVLLCLGYLALSSTSFGPTFSTKDLERLLAESGQLRLCQVELERATTGRGLLSEPITEGAQGEAAGAGAGAEDSCSETLRKTQASLSAALGLPVGDPSALLALAPPASSEAQGDKPCSCPKQDCPKQNCPKQKCPKPNCPKQNCPKQDSSKQDCPKQDCPNVECPKQECPKVECAPGAAAGAAGAIPSSVDGLKWKDTAAMDTAALRAEVADLRDMAQRLISEKVRLENQLKGSASWGEKAVTEEAIASAKKLLGDCNTPVAPANSGGSGENITVWKGYQCKASNAELSRFLDYTPRALCPQDWYFAQKLMYMKDCFALPRRRCLSITPPKPQEPMPFPESLFDQAALMDSNVRWDLHQCKSFECLNSRQIGDCRNCFSLQLEERRWKSQYRGSIKMADVIKMKNGTLRLGLDAGGGTGSFAAHMARYNVTVMTSAFNVETVPGRKGGLPYMEAIALRGLIPLHVPHKSRLPLYDGTLDVIHSVNSIKYIIPVEFEELIFEWDRVLRAGGILWFEMFYAPVSEMPVYVQIIEMLGYKKLYWNYTPKPDAGEREGEHVYLNCVIEKPARPGKEVLDGPPEVDTADMI